MGASQEKKKRRAASVDDTAKNAKKKKKGVSTKVKVIIAVVVVVLVAAAAFYFTSDYFYQHTIAMRIGDMEYSITDFNYFYWRSYQDYYENVMENYPDTYANYLPNTNLPYDEQYYSDGVTWDQYLEDQAVSLMQEMTFLYTHAVEEGYDPSDISVEGQNTIANNMYNSQLYAQNYGYSNMDAYLAASFGKGMDEETYRMNLERYVFAQEYAKKKAAEFEFDADDLADYYELMKDEYDILEYRSFNFALETGDGVDEESAKDDAYYKASDFMKDIKTEEDFIAKAREYAPEDQKEAYEDDAKTLTSAMATNIDVSYKDWLLEEGRKPGDMDIMEVDGGYDVVYFVSRGDNSYNLANARHILVQIDTVQESDYDGDEAAYEAAVAEADAAAKTEIEEIRQEWLDEGGTEDQFAALADEKSDDNAEGGLYEDIYKGMMVSEFNDWLFADGRKAGDYDIVKSDAGYHLIYFVGYGERYCDYIAQTDLGAQAYEEWYEDNFKDYNETRTWAFRLTK